jgi:ribose transport system permease protein
MEPAASATPSVVSPFRWGAIRELPALVLLLIAGTWLVLTKSSFRTADNLAQVGQEAAFIGIMACGEAMVILTGGIDLSVGATLALSACVAASRMTSGTSWVIAALLALAVGATAGLLNGALITYRRLPPILTTLGTLFIFRALTNIQTRAVPYNQLPEGFKKFGQGIVPFLIFVFVTGACALLLARSRLGRRIVATGGSEQSTRLSGVPVDAVLRRVYILAGVLSALAGLLMGASTNNVQWSLADGWELDVIAAVVIGGVRLTGGEGSVIGAALGAMIIVVMRNALFLSGVPTERYGLITGAVILIASLTEQFRRGRQEVAA